MDRFIIFFVLFVIVMGGNALGLDGWAIAMWLGGFVLLGLIGTAFYNDVTGKTGEMIEQRQRQEQAERDSRRPNRDILE